MAPASSPPALPKPGPASASAKPGPASTSAKPKTQPKAKRQAKSGSGCDNDSECSGSYTWADFSDVQQSFDLNEAETIEVLTNLCGPPPEDWCAPSSAKKQKTRKPKQRLCRATRNQKPTRKTSLKRGSKTRTLKRLRASPPSAERL